VPNDNVTGLIQPGFFDDQLTEILRNGARALLAKAVEVEGRGLSRQACRFEDPGRPPARGPPRSPAGTRGDDRYRSGHRSPAACA